MGEVALGEKLPTVENVNVAADETDGEVTFLRTVRPGPTDRSYGVHVADIAGVPDPVVDRSRDVLDRLRENKAIDVRGGERDGDATTQVVFDLDSGTLSQGGAGATDQPVATGGSHERGQALDTEMEAVLEELEALDVNETPPVELMAKVQEWQKELDDD